jgi:hypothetical protein
MPRIRQGAFAEKSQAAVLVGFAACQPSGSFGIMLESRKRRMCMLDEIRAKRDEIYAIARKHKAEKLWVFGSCARKEERPDSDVDFIVALDDGASLFTLSRLKNSLSDFLDRKVDLVSRRCLDDGSMFAFEARKDLVAV